MYRQQSLAWQAAIEEFLSHVSHLAEPSSSCGSLFVLSKFRNSRFLALWCIELERIQTASASMRAQSIPRCRLPAGIHKNFAFIPSHMWAIDSDDSGSEDEDKHSTFSTNASKLFDAKD
jgi:hypothetical protein